MLGALVAWKRPELALEAVAIARRSLPELRLRIVGAPLLGDGRPLLRPAASTRAAAVRPRGRGRASSGDEIDDPPARRACELPAALRAAGTVRDGRRRGARRRPAGGRARRRGARPRSSTTRAAACFAARRHAGGGQGDHRRRVRPRARRDDGRSAGRRAGAGSRFDREARTARPVRRRAGGAAAAAAGVRSPRARDRDPQLWSAELRGAAGVDRPSPAGRPARDRRRQRFLERRSVAVARAMVVR